MSQVQSSGGRFGTGALRAASRSDTVQPLSAERSAGRPPGGLVTASDEQQRKEVKKGGPSNTASSASNSGSATRGIITLGRGEVYGRQIFGFHRADSLLTFCKKCGEHQPHKVTQYKKIPAHRKRCYDRKQSGYHGHTKPIFWKKAKTTKKTVLWLECVDAHCGSKRMLAVRRCRRFELGGDKNRKGRVIQF
ncbi:LOW QUALITY PROTEIN: uncharacterized protein ACOB6Z_015171 [Ctenodactylus gundi]